MPLSITTSSDSFEVSSSSSDLREIDSKKTGLSVQPTEPGEAFINIFEVSPAVTLKPDVEFSMKINF